MYGSLGVDLWMLKLHSRLSVLGGTARTFTGHVRSPLDIVAGSHPASVLCPKNGLLCAQIARLQQ